MPERRPIDSQAVTFMMFLSALWGMQQVALKVASDDMAPLMQIVFRSAIAAVLVGAIILFKKQKFQLSETWKAGLLAGIFFSLEYSFVAESLRYTSASHVTVLLYSAPIFVALALHFLDRLERLNPLQWAGIGLAFTGIAFAFLLREEGTSELSQQTLWGDFLALLAGISWAAVTICVRSTKLATIPATQTLFYQVFVSGIILAASAIITDQTSYTMTTLVWSSLLYQGVIVCCLSFIAWYWLLTQYPASQLGVFSFVTPLFGIICGVWILDERLEFSFIGGAGLVLVGVVLVTLRRETLRKLREKLVRK
jgi:drug/metabolite transporter (DMT)-like permease